MGKGRTPRAKLLEVCIKLHEANRNKMQPDALISKNSVREGTGGGGRVEVAVLVICV